MMFGCEGQRVKHESYMYKATRFMYMAKTRSDKAGEVEGHKYEDRMQRHQAITIEKDVFQELC